MKMKVIFKGYLSKICPDIYEVEAESAREAIKGVSNQLPQLIRKNRHRFMCKVKDYNTSEDIDSTPKSDTLELYPVFAPSGGGSGRTWAMIGIGVLMIVLAFFTAGASFTGAGVLASMLGGTGTSLVLGGITQLLTPMPDDKEDTEPENSRYFGQRKNTTAVGTRIAIGYGRYRVYGQILSFNLQAVDRDA